MGPKTNVSLSLSLCLSIRWYFAYWLTCCSDLVSYMKFDDINIDNWMFKLYYKFSFVICMTGKSAFLKYSPLVCLALFIANVRTLCHKNILKISFKQYTKKNLHMCFKNDIYRCYCGHCEPVLWRPH